MESAPHSQSPILINRDLAATTSSSLSGRNDKYRQYVEDQTKQLESMTAKFVTAYQAGKDDKARALYPVARMHWERIETVAESFGDLDPKLDLREADLEPGQKWTGWHRLEKDL